MEKDAILHIRINKNKKNKIEKDAEKQGLNVPAYVSAAIDFYGSFDVHFLEQMNMTAEKLKLPIPTVIQQLLVAYTSADIAIMKTFGTGGKTYQRAFQYDENGLIEGIEHMNLVRSQVSGESSNLIKKLEKGVRTGKPVLITKDDAMLLAARL